MAFEKRRNVIEGILNLVEPKLSKQHIDGVLSDKDLYIVFDQSRYKTKNLKGDDLNKKILSDRYSYFGDKFMRGIIAFILYKKQPYMVKSKCLTNIRKTFEDNNEKSYLYKEILNKKYNGVSFIDCIVFPEDSIVESKKKVVYYEIARDSWYIFIYILDRYFKNIGPSITFVILEKLYNNCNKIYENTISNRDFIGFSKKIKGIEVKSEIDIVDKHFNDNESIYRWKSIDNKDSTLNKWTTIINYKNTIYTGEANEKIDSQEAAFASLLKLPEFKDLKTEYFEYGKNKNIHREKGVKYNTNNIVDIVKLYSSIDTNNLSQYTYGKMYNDILYMVCINESIDDKYNYEWLEFFGDLFYNSFVARYIDEEFKTVKCKVWIHEIYSYYTRGSERDHFQVLLSDRLGLSQRLKTKDKIEFKTRGDLLEALFGAITLIGNKCIDIDNKKYDMFTGYYIGYNFFKNLIKTVSMDRSIFTPRYLKNDFNILQETFSVKNINDEKATNGIKIDNVTRHYIIPADNINDISMFKSIGLKQWKRMRVGKIVYKDIDYYMFDVDKLKEFIDICIKNKIITVPNTIYENDCTVRSIFDTRSYTIDDDVESVEDEVSVEDIDTIKDDIESVEDIDTIKDGVEDKESVASKTFLISDGSGFDTYYLNTILLNNGYVVGDRDLNHIDLLWTNILDTKRLEVFPNIKTYNVKSLLYIDKNGNNGIEIITDKSLLHLALKDTDIVVPSISISPKEKTFKNVELFVKKYNLVIVRPVGKGAYGGNDIILTRDVKEIKAHISGKNNYSSFIISEYIRDPMLLDGKKFHIRIYMALYYKEGGETGYAIFNRGRVFTAREEYNIDDLSKDIHDTHISSTDGNLFYPEDLQSIPEFAKNRIAIHNNIKDICKKLYEISKDRTRPYPESRSAFETFALDIMVTEDLKPILLEVNNKVEYTDKDNSTGKFKIFCKDMTSWICNYILNLLLDIDCKDRVAIPLLSKTVESDDENGFAEETGSRNGSVDSDDQDNKHDNQQDDEKVDREEPLVEGWAGDRASVDIEYKYNNTESKRMFKIFQGKLFSRTDITDEKKKNICSIVSNIEHIERYNQSILIDVFCIDKDVYRHLNDSNSIVTTMDDEKIRKLNLKKIIFLRYYKRFKTG